MAGAEVEPVRKSLVGQTEWLVKVLAMIVTGSESKEELVGSKISIIDTVLSVHSLYVFVCKRS